MSNTAALKEIKEAPKKKQAATLTIEDPNDQPFGKV